MSETPKPPRNWPLLAEMLRAQWIDAKPQDGEAAGYHYGLFEGRYEAAHWMATATPEEREDLLYRKLRETLMHAREERRDE